MAEEHTQLPFVIDGARLVKTDTEARLVYVWTGGHGVNVYDYTGEEVGFFNVGSFENDSATRSQVLEAVEEKMV